ncbi:hypothetical protein OB69_09280 [Roseivirga seohaensis subsp. aquiponti]|uniref:Uncharacterized protein n=1 Tax=Roseivirga seohaensis subsp. aquiponti TaxID=1566026 RepID=A0A0L8AKU1_9BACT|nr:hypothetical protein OB69_09280 [Roseivirga seohaensis subsp. aquiponti]
MEEIDILNLGEKPIYGRNCWLLKIKKGLSEKSRQPLFYPDTYLRKLSNTRFSEGLFYFLDTLFSIH